jgi:hypothetical protein
MQKYIPNDLIKYVVCNYISHNILEVMQSQNIQLHKNRKHQHIKNITHNLGGDLDDCIVEPIINDFVDNKIVFHSDLMNSITTIWHHNKVVSIDNYYNCSNKIQVTSSTICINNKLSKQLKYENNGNIIKKSLYKDGVKYKVKYYEYKDLVVTKIYPLNVTYYPESYMIRYKYYNTGYNLLYNVWPNHYLKSVNRYILGHGGGINSSHPSEQLHGAQYYWDYKGLMTIKHYEYNRCIDGAIDYDDFNEIKLIKN